MKFLVSWSIIDIADKNEGQVTTLPPKYLHRLV